MNGSDREKGEPRPRKEITPGDLLMQLARNFNEQRQLSERLEELDDEAAALHELLGPVFEDQEVIRVIIYCDGAPMVATVVPTHCFGLDITFAEAVSVYKLTWPEPDPGPEETSPSAVISPEALIRSLRDPLVIGDQSA